MRLTNSMSCFFFLSCCALGSHSSCLQHLSREGGSGAAALPPPAPHRDVSRRCQTVGTHSWLRRRLRSQSARLSGPEPATLCRSHVDTPGGQADRASSSVFWSSLGVTDKSSRVCVCVCVRLCACSTRFHPEAKVKLSTVSN